MPGAGVICGNELHALVRFTGDVVPSDHEHVLVGVDPSALHADGPTLGKTPLEQAQEILRRDLAVKAEPAAAFVSIRLHVGDVAWRIKATAAVIDLARAQDDLDEIFERCDASTGFVLRPQEFVIFRSLEKLWLPGDVAAFVQSRTTISMHGLDVTPTNLVVPGFRNAGLVLEVSNLTGKEVHVPRFSSLAEVFFLRGTDQAKAVTKEYTNAAQQLGRSSVCVPGVAPERPGEGGGFFGVTLERLADVVIAGIAIWLGVLAVGLVNRYVSGEHWRYMLYAVAVLGLLVLYVAAGSRLQRFLSRVAKRIGGEKT
jgi:deoxycytidine triphosphate deaminase